MSVLDLIVVIIYVSGIMLAGLSMWVIFKHIQAWNRDERGLLPLHIWTVAGSYLLLVIVVLIEIQELADKFWIILPAFLMGVTAMVPLSEHQKERTENDDS